MADNLYLVTADGTFTNIANWSQGVVPSGADGFVTRFDINSPNVSLGASRIVNFLDCSGYLGTITGVGYNLQVLGTTTLTNTMTLNLGNGSVMCSGSGNITSNGLTGFNLRIGGVSQTFTLIDNFTINNLLLGETTGAVINGNTIYIAGTLSSSTTAITSGTTNIVMNDTGTWSNSSTGQLRNNLTISSSNVTISGIVRYNTGTLTISVPIIHLNSHLYIASSAIIDVNSAGEFGTLRRSGNNTVTLLSDINCHTFLVGITLLATNMSGNYNINVSGDYTVNVTTGSVSGGNIVMTGDGTFSMPVLTTGSHRNNLTINTAGTIVVSGTIRHWIGLIKIISGTIDATGSTLELVVCSLDLQGQTLNNVTLTYSLGSVVTLKSELKILGILSNANLHATNDKFISDVVGNKRKLTMLAGSSQTITDLDGTDIDSADGYPIITSGALSNTSNWYSELPNKMFLNL